VSATDAQRDSFQELIEELRLFEAMDD